MLTLTHARGSRADALIGASFARYSPTNPSICQVGGPTRVNMERTQKSYLQAGHKLLECGPCGHIGVHAPGARQASNLMIHYYLLQWTKPLLTGHNFYMLPA
eukprot:982645-Pelagomonas_calceolata.AAC.1